MSRTTLCVLTAAALTLGVLAVAGLRHYALGDDVKLPTGPGTWRVTMLVHGRVGENARLETAVPAETADQHVSREKFECDTLTARTHDRPKKPARGGRREVTWEPKSANSAGPFRARYECHVTLTGREEPAAGLYGPPAPGQYLRGTTDDGSDHAAVRELARRLTEGTVHPADQAAALFHHVEDEIDNEPNIGGEPARPDECLTRGSGDPLAKAGLLAALLRNRGLPARLVTGLPLGRDHEQRAHAWVEAFVRDAWLPMDPFAHHYGRLPRDTLTLSVGDPRVAHGKNVHSADHAFLAERVNPAADSQASWLRRFFVETSPYALAPAEQKLVEFLLLLPPAALVVCVFRNIVGVLTFGTFAPALLGLAFREGRSVAGAGIFVGILITGWLLRRGLDRFHLLQVPRTSLMLTLVVTLLAAFITASHAFGWQATQYIALFPLVILTGMIERFWTIDEEDGAAASFRTLLVTVAVSGCIGLLLSIPAVARHMFRYPETVGLVMAALLLLGRYTGYRLSELYRFRDVIAGDTAAPPARPQDDRGP